MEDPTGGPGLRRYLAAGILSAAALSGCAESPPTEGETSSPSPSSAHCADEGVHCLGELEAGTYSSSTFDPAVTYTVREGWTNLADEPDIVMLTPTGVTFDDLIHDEGFALILATDSTAATEDCEPHAASGLETPEAILGHLQSRPSLQITGVENVEIGGLEGVMFDTEIVDGQDLLCPGFEDQSWVPALIALDEGVATWAIGPAPGTLNRYILLSHDRQVISISIDSNSAEGADDPKVDQMMDIVASMEFDLPVT